MKTPTANRPLTLACTHNTHASTVNVHLEGKGVWGTVEVYYSGHREGLCSNFEITLLGYMHKGRTDLYPKDSGAVSRPFFLASCERRVGHSGQPASDAAKKQIAEVLDRVFARVSADWGKELRESNERANRENRRSLTNKIEELTERPAVLVACADSLEYLRAIPDGTYHACVTDPPYGLGDPPDPADVLQQWATAGDWHPRSGKAKGFMGAAWDKFVPGPAIWREVFRVLKPGAYCAVFAGTRTWDWMSLALRFAGFEVTDTLMWLHGQGFPKGGDVGKRIDEMLGAEREVVGEHPNPAGNRPGGSAYMMGVTGMPETAQITAPATPAAARWHDCSTTLKPAWEPIILAQKPHQGSAARNCVEHGAGALRVGACRIGWASEADKEAGRPASFSKAHAGFDGKAFEIADRSHRDPVAEQPAAGRWPANIALDEEAAAALDEQSGDLKSGGGDKRNKSAPKGWSGNWTDSASKRDWTVSSGGASRFFYCAKANKGDRDEGLDGDARNRHPTVKPEALMRWLSRLVCPPWGELLDPFAGSGSTGKAAALEGLRATLVEREPDFAEVARARVAAALCRAAESAPADADAQNKRGPERS